MAIHLLFYGFGPLCCKSIEQRPWSYLFHNKIFQENTQYSNRNEPHKQLNGPKTQSNYQLSIPKTAFFVRLCTSNIKFPNWWELIKTRVQQSKALEEMECFRYLNYNFAEFIIDLTSWNAILKFPIDYY